MLSSFFILQFCFIFEYPVFKADIKAEGYKILSLGDQYKKRSDTNLIEVDRRTIASTSDKTITWLLSNRTQSILNQNFNIGNKYHGNNALKRLLNRCIKN